MRLHRPLSDHVRGFRDLHGTNLALWVGLGFFALYIASVCMGAKQMMAVLALTVLVCLATVSLRMTVLSCTVWLLIAGTSPEMWLGDLVPGTSNTITAIVKVVGLGLVGICILRYGLVFDLLNPGIAFALMFVIGLAHGLWPGLTTDDSLRTLIGSAAPFAFSFSRLSRRWCASIIQATMWIPTLIIVFGCLLAAAHLRPLLAADEGGSVRLAGSTHPAFLAVYAMTGAYAALVELYRTGRTRYLMIFGLNALILLATGSRSPLACEVMTAGVAFVALRSRSFTLRKRVLPMLLGLFALPVLLALSATTDSLRLLTMLSGHATNLSGRDVIWPFFEAAWDQSPWFGWGVGTGKEVVDPNSMTAKLLGTTAAHNEYLRIGVEGGYVGLGLLAGFMALWCWWWSRRLASTDKVIMRLVMLGVAIECITDNMLIAAPASILFTWMSAVFARGGFEQQPVTGAAAPDRVLSGQLSRRLPALAVPRLSRS